MFSAARHNCDCDQYSTNTSTCDVFFFDRLITNRSLIDPSFTLCQLWAILLQFGIRMFNTAVRSLATHWSIWQLSRCFACKHDCFDHHSSIPGACLWATVRPCCYCSLNQATARGRPLSSMVVKSRYIGSWRRIRRVKRDRATRLQMQCRLRL